MNELIVAELKRGILELTGRDRVRFLHNMCTNDIKSLKPGEGCFAAIVNRQGKMVGAFQVMCFEDRFLLSGEPEAMAAVRAAMEKFIVMDDVTITERGAQIVGVLESSQDVGLFQIRREGGRTITRTPVGIEIWDDPSLVATPDAGEAYERARIEVGWPKWGVDMTSDHLPMEAGLEPVAISYTKGCYIGQEVIQRVKTYSEPPQRLVSLHFEDYAPPPGTILVDGKPVGQMTSSARFKGLGMVRKEWKEPDTKVQVAGATATVEPLAWSANLK